jgi:LmbE family N-acetylglucosaminyl deacetylase
VDLLLSPHNDDETLFAAYTIMRHQPHVVICLKSQVQENRYGILASTREAETRHALRLLGITSWEQSLILDTDTEPEPKLVELMDSLENRYAPGIVWAPFSEEGGHEQHNLISFFALRAFEERTRFYCTYTRGQGRSRRVEVQATAGMVARKMRALSSYKSQIELENTRYWFVDDTLREYVP